MPEDSFSRPVCIHSYVVAGDELAPVETVVSAAVRLAETDHHQPVVVGEHVLLGAHAHRVPTLHTTVGVHKKFKNTSL